MVVLGFLYLGALPSTVQSSAAYTSLAGGNVANAVIGAAVLNVTGVFVSAPLFGLLAGGNSAVFSTQVLVKIALILLLPFLLGQALQGRFGGTVNRYPGVIRWMDRMAIALAIYVGMSGAVTGGVGELVSAAGWAWLLGAVLILLFVAGILSLIVARLLRLPRRSQISFQFAGMQKSIAMGAPLATILFDAESAGLILLPVLAYHFCQMVVAAPIAARWRNSEEAGGPINPA
jgi:sodium/bile acid cotransporter 7